MPEINKDQLAESTRWIPCRERLPENGQAVIGCDRSGFITRFRFDGDAPPCWVDDHEEFFPLNRIVAWMPLPDPPEMEEEPHES